MGIPVIGVKQRDALEIIRHQNLKRQASASPPRTWRDRHQDQVLLQSQLLLGADNPTSGPNAAPVAGSTVERMVKALVGNI